jgi:hypothetical protein
MIYVQELKWIFDNVDLILRFDDGYREALEKHLVDTLSLDSESMSLIKGLFVCSVTDERGSGIVLFTRSSFFRSMQ